MSEFERVQSKYKKKSKLGGEFRGYSHYLLTVNFKVKGGDPRLLEYANLVRAYIKQCPDEVLDADDWSKIEAIDITGGVPEYGPKTGELHFAVFVKIRHQTKVRVNVPRTKLIASSLDPEVKGLNPGFGSSSWQTPRT